MTSAMPRRPTVSVEGGRGDASHVANHHRIDGEQLRVRGRIGRERAADLLLALDHDLDPDRGPPTPGAQGADVHEDVRLRVGRAAAEDRPVALGRLERRRLPLRLVADRDDVVVPVEEDGRRSVGGGDLADDHRRGVGQLEELELLHTESRRSSETASRPRAAPGGSRAETRARTPTGSRRAAPGLLQARHRRRDSRGECVVVDVPCHALRRVAVRRPGRPGLERAARIGDHRSSPMGAGAVKRERSAAGRWAASAGRTARARRDAPGARSARTGPPRAGRPGRRELGPEEERRGVEVDRVEKTRTAVIEP
jgi:hypothetical protein